MIRLKKNLNFILKKDYASAHNEFGKILDKPSESDFEITADTEGEKIFCAYVINSVVDRGPGAIFR